MPHSPVLSDIARSAMPTTPGQPGECVLTQEQMDAIAALTPREMAALVTSQVDVQAGDTDLAFENNATLLEHWYRSKGGRK